MIKAGIVNDKQLRYQYWLDTPFGNPGGTSREDATKNPGNCVKSIERRRDGPPKYCGRLAKYLDPDEAAVISHDATGGDVFVWTGSCSEYLTLWEVD